MYTIVPSLSADVKSLLTNFARAFFQLARPDRNRLWSSVIFNSARRLYRWKIAWLQGLVAEKILEADDGLIVRLLLHFTVADGRRDEGLRSAINTHGGKVGGNGCGRTNFWPALRKLEKNRR